MLVPLQVPTALSLVEKGAKMFTPAFTTSGLMRPSSTGPELLKVAITTGSTVLFTAPTVSRLLATP